jgi:hypothetical protein
LGRIDVPFTVPPGSAATFTFTVIPPMRYGSQPFRWRMLQEGVTWFGDFTPLTQVKVTLPGGQVTVPDVRELQTEAALRIIKDASLKAVTAGTSTNSYVASQKPAPDTKVDRGSDVTLQTKRGSPP